MKFKFSKNQWVIFTSLGFLMSASQACSFKESHRKNVIERRSAGAMTKALESSQVKDARPLEHGEVNTDLADGRELYKANCSSCHGAIEVSVKKNRSASEIATAIGSVPQMAHLKALATAQIDAISVALRTGISFAGKGGQNPFTCKPENKLVRSADQLRRLTIEEYRNSLSDLFGKYLGTNSVATRTADLPSDAFDGVFSNKDQKVSVNHLRAWDMVAKGIAETVVNSSDARTSFFGCTTSYTEACIGSFLGGQNAARIFRHPWSDSEKSGHLSLWKDVATISDSDTATKTLLSAMLLEPSFLYKVELGDSSFANRLGPVSSFELAHRLSFAFWASLPDDLLWSKAVDGSILKDEVYKAEVQRLKNSVRFKERAADFVQAILGGFRRSGGLNYSPAVSAGVDVSKLDVQSSNEFRLLVKDILFAQAGNYKDLLLTQKSYAVGEQLAAIYAADELRTLPSSMGMSLGTYTMDMFQFKGNAHEDGGNGTRVWNPHGNDARATLTFKVPAGGSLNVKFLARGEPIQNVFPIAFLKLSKGGIEVAKSETIEVNSKADSEYNFEVPTVTAGDYSLELGTVNDAYNQASGEDRNLFYRSVSVKIGDDSSMNVASATAISSVKGRSGVLSRAAFLISGNDETHAVHRGVSVRKNFLCDDLQPPNMTPETAALFTPFIADASKSMRQQIEERTANPYCLGCHSRINPMGFALENFDSLGRFRTSEKIFDKSGKVVAEHPVNLSVKPNVDSPDEAEVNSWEGMATAIAGSSRGPACFVQRWHEFVYQKAADPRDLCELSTQYDLLQNAPTSALVRGVKPGSLGSVFEGLVSSPEFKLLRKD